MSENGMSDGDEIVEPGFMRAIDCEAASRTAGEPILQFFAFGHLPEPLQEISMPFANLAVRIVSGLPRNAERSTALRKLLESKDAAVRARLGKTWPPKAPPAAEVSKQIEPSER